MIEIRNEYDVNQKTMALLSVAHPDYSTVVIEQHRQLFVKQTPLQIIKAACLDGGSTFEGRQKAVTHLTGSRQKVPIPINPLLNIFTFPTNSPYDFHCNWIFYHHVKSIIPSDKRKNSTTQVIISFKNDEQLQMKESHHILQKQMQRTAICILQFTNQIHELVN